MVTKIQLAAMSRSDIPDIKDRRPFYLYVDEFQNFATDSFATILSEARKYGLNLTVANQYISQMSDTVRDAVFGNVGTMISFRVSADDAPILSKQFEPQFESNDLLQMHNRNFIINMVINGEKTPAFSASTLTLPTPREDYSRNIIENTRRHYSRSRADIEKEISEAIQPPDSVVSKKPQSQNSAKRWPIDAGARTSQPQRSPQQQPQTPSQPRPQHNDIPTGQASDDEAPKKKRTRTRKRKPAADTGDSRPVISQPRDQPARPAPQTNDSNELNVR